MRRGALTSALLPLVYSAFVMALMWAAAHEGPVWLCAVPLLALGLPLLVTPFAALKAARSTFYVVTDRRALIFEGEEIFSHEHIDALQTRAREDGSGDIWFVIGDEKRPGFFGVPEVRKVETLLRAVC
jgi:hypothetical protein